MGCTILEVNFDKLTSQVKTLQRSLFQKLLAAMDLFLSFSATFATPHMHFDSDHNNDQLL